MIPPSMQQQQAMQMQRGMMQQRPEDPLLQALSQQAMAGEMLKETANHKMKMIKLRAKYGGMMGAQPQPQGPGPGMMGPQGQTYY
jgi:hypothetical protein